MKKIILIAFLFLFSCKCEIIKPKKMEAPILVTTDGKKYQFKKFTIEKTSTLGVGATMYPAVNVTTNNELIGGTTAWEDIGWTNQINKFIPLVFSQTAWQTAVNPHQIYRFTTPYLVQSSTPSGRNSFSLVVGPQSQLIDNTLSSYPSAGDFRTVAWSGNIRLPDPAYLIFHSDDFLPVASPNSSTVCTFRPTYNLSTYMSQGPMFLLCPVANDLQNASGIGYKPGFGSPTQITVRTEVLYIELI